MNEHMSAACRRASSEASLPGWLLRGERPYLAANLALTVITAWFSTTFFHPDEHYQVLEFLGLKLGFSEPSELPWEYGARIRPWLQPMLYYVLAAPLVSLGLTDRFTLAWLLRLASGLLAFAALRTTVHVSRPWLRDPESQRRRVQFLTLAGFLPYLAVRTSAENLAQAWFLFGFAWLMRGRPPEGEAPAPALPWRNALVAGSCFGCAFECRYQTSVLIAGSLSWLWFVGRVGSRPIATVLAGVSGVLVASLFIDRWGYGVWAFPPYEYLRVNLVEQAAARYGTYPFYAYLYAMLPNPFAPVVLLMILALLVCWMRRPRHVVTFCTVPFVLVHSAIAHKEERFLFPIAILTLLAAALALEPSTPQSTAARLGAALRAFTRTRAYAVIVGLNFAAMVLLAVYPLGWRPHIPFYRWAEQAMHEPGPVELISANADMVPSYPFYRRKPWQISAGPAAANGPVYEIRSEPFTARPPAHELVYSEFPGWQVPWLRQQIFPKLAELHAWALPRIDKPDRLIWLSAYRVPPP